LKLKTLEKCWFQPKAELNPEKTKLAVIFNLGNDLDELKLIGTDLKQLLWAEDKDKPCL